eukprot:9437949-Pyramimonas_sp.AAC.1
MRAWSDSVSLHSLRGSYAWICWTGHANMSICDSLSLPILVGPGMCMAAEPELVRTPLRRAAASTPPSLGCSSCKLTPPP